MAERNCSNKPRTHAIPAVGAETGEDGYANQPMMRNMLHQQKWPRTRGDLRSSKKMPAWCKMAAFSVAVEWLRCYEDNKGFFDPADPAENFEVFQAVPFSLERDIAGLSREQRKRVTLQLMGISDAFWTARGSGGDVGLGATKRAVHHMVWKMQMALIEEEEQEKRIVETAALTTTTATALAASFVKRVRGIFGRRSSCSAAIDGAGSGESVPRVAE
ncbi:hypothetical protein GGF32_004577 [Allomyces javanicus]|nr:hypothetical protein GGF32_004577 [Allomyces javanicus]